MLVGLFIVNKAIHFRVVMQPASHVASDIRHMADPCLTMAYFHGAVGIFARSNAIDPVLDVVFSKATAIVMVADFWCWGVCD